MSKPNWLTKVIAGNDYNIARANFIELQCFEAKNPTSLVNASQHLLLCSLTVDFDGHLIRNPKP